MSTEDDTCDDGDGSSSSESQKQSMDVLASCAGDMCLDRQRELVECLMYETTAAEDLNAQLVLDVQSLTSQLGSATASKERSTVVLFDKINQLDMAFNEYRAAASVADVTAHKHAKQQNVVREARACTERIRSQLVEAKAELTAAINCNVGSGVGSAQRNFGVYASGCRPGEHEKTTTCSTSCATTACKTTCKTKTTP